MSNTTQYAGINYAGHSNANKDTSTGIRYGIISQHSVNPEALDDIFQNGQDLDYEEFQAQVKAELRSALSDYLSDHKWGDEKQSKLDIAVGDCWDCVEQEVNDTYAMRQDGCNHMRYENGGEVVQTDSSGDLWVLKSPYYTYAQFCSPCAPGACHLDNPLAEPVEANKCYCLGHDWFDGNKAPYPVFNMNGQLVASPEN